VSEQWSAQRFRKKPVVIEAAQLVDDLNELRVVADWVVDNGGRVWEPLLPSAEHVMTIQTLEGNMDAALGDWVIRGVQGEFYPCKPDIFKATYEPAGDDSEGTEKT
jgi:hypothetical protein